MHEPATIRIGQAAELLDVSVETLRRWGARGRLTVTRSAGGQRRVSLAEVSRVLADRRREGRRPSRPVVAQSARNRFSGIVTRIERDRVAAVIEVQCGPHRLVSLVTAEAVDDLGLRVGDEAVCAIKATNVVVEVPGVIRTLFPVALLLSACVSPPATTAGSITVFAAASLTDAFEDIATAYHEETGIEVVLSFDSSSTLRAQIEEGAPADVFASADLVNAQSVVDEGLTDGPGRVFAGTALTIVVPVDNPAGIDGWTMLAGSGLRIIAAGEDVPITRYAVEMVHKLAALPDAPDGFADAYAASIVSREDNVRAVLAKIEIGEGDAAIVYETDARSSTDVQPIRVPEDADVVAEYAVVTLADASPNANAFVAWLLEAEAQAILADHGFRPPSSSGIRGVAVPIAAALLGSFLALPIVALVARAMTGGAAVDSGVAAALRLSLLTTAASLILVLALGTPLAWVLARRSFLGRRLAEALVDLPIVLPPAVAGLGLLLLLGRRGPVGSIGLEVAFTTVAVVLAQTFVAAPFYVRAARGAFAMTHRDLEDAARIDGGDEWAVFRRVTVPLAAPVLVGGAILAWARALGEFGATIMFAGNVTGVTQTLPLAVYAEFQSSLDASVAAAAILVGAAFAVLLGIRLLRIDRGADA